jgi:acetyltransferase-like isoleucine patch superfamily enzyme
MIRRMLEMLAVDHNLVPSLFKHLGRPDGKGWAEYLRRHGQLSHVGADCSILPSTRIVDPPYTWIGDRVCLAACTLICHDGAIEMLYHRHGVRLDRVLPIVIEDDVFVGEGAIVLGGTTIGEGSIVGAGSVLRQRVPPGSVVTGNPAKVVGKVEDMLRFWEAESLALPWADLIARREGAFDPAMEPELRRLRQEHFFKALNPRIGPGTNPGVSPGTSPGISTGISPGRRGDSVA